MRLVKRPELMDMPPGTLYSVLREPWVFTDLYIKGETIRWADGGDFYERGLLWVDAADTGEAFDRLHAMLKDSAVSYPAERGYGREGLFDDERVYLVFEAADVESIVRELR